MSRQRHRQTASPDDLFARGVELYRGGHFDQAAEELNQLRDVPSMVSQVAAFYEGMAQRALGVAALREGKFDLAEGYLRNAAKIIGPEADLSAYLASLYARTGRADMCRLAMARLADESPDDATTQRKLAQAQWQAGRREEAMMTVLAALRRVGTDSGLHLQLGLFYSAEDRLAQARVCFQQAIDCDCDNADAHYYLALTFAARGKYDATVRELQRSFDLMPANLLVGYQLALAAKAAETQGFRVVLRLPEDHAPDTRSEMQRLARYVAEEPQFLDAMLAMPRSAIDDELFALLVGVVKTALSDHPDYADLHFHCSRILDRLDQSDDAMSHARKALAINPGYAQGLIHAGDLAAKVDLPAEAANFWQRAIAAGGDWPDVHYRLARVLTDSGDTERARRHLSSALTRNPRYTEAAEALRKLAA
ncbi:MAG: tetratricopeptide repeat protein [Planctomycetota bacterium]|jgi:tetratricopeptide (TPR) repeat protein